MELVNRSAEPPWVVRGWLPRGLEAERVVFLPDACPGRSPLPTGTAVLTRQPDWRRFAISDCGCGMRLLASGLEPAALTRAAWEEATPDAVLRGEGPHAYRDLDACLSLVAGAVEVERRYAVVAYLGRL